MNDITLIIESLRLLVIGMLIVYAFLFLLVGIVRLMSSLVLRVAPPEAAAELSQPGGGSDGALIAVITAAVARYRATH